MNENSRESKDEFQQAKIIAISKTAKSIKTVYSTVLIIFIVAVIIAGVLIANKLFSSGSVTVSDDKAPQVNEIIHTDVVNKSGKLPLKSDRLDLKNRMIGEDEDVVIVSPIDDVVRNENSLGGFDAKNVDPEVLKQFQELMNKGIEEFSAYNYQKALEIFNTARKFKEIWYTEIKRANSYYDICMCMLDIKKGITPFLDEYKLVKLIPPVDFEGDEFLGFISKKADLEHAIETGNKIYLNFMHEVGGKYYQLDNTWKYEELTKDEVSKKLSEYFKVMEKSIKQKTMLNKIHPMDYVNGMIKFALSIGDFDGFDSKTVAHNYLLDAFELDKYLFETINLYKDKRYYEWLKLIEKNELEKAVNVRKDLTLNYPNAWEFQTDNPEKDIIEKINADAIDDSNIDYDPSNDPNILKKRRNLATKSTREKIHFYSEYGAEAEKRGDNGWAAILESTDNDNKINEMLLDVIDQWKIAKYWYREAQKLTTDERDSQELEQKKVNINKNIYWAKKRLR